MWLIAGLGNPGSKYEKTWHNAGFAVVDTLKERYAVSLAGKFNALCGSGNIENDKVLLLKPLSFMNASGGPIKEAMNYFKIEPQKLIIIHDDIDLELGDVKLKFGGGLGGHNGLRSISGALGTDDYFRVRLGVGRGKSVLGEKNAGGHVLAKATGKNSAEFVILAETGADAVQSLINEGLAKTQGIYHTK